MHRCEPPPPPRRRCGGVQVVPALRATFGNSDADERIAAGTTPAFVGHSGGCGVEAASRRVAGDAGLFQQRRRDADLVPEGGLMELGGEAAQFEGVSEHFGLEVARETIERGGVCRGVGGGRGVCDRRRRRAAVLPGSPS